MKQSRVAETEVTLEVERVGANDVELKLTVPQAQALAVDILARHPFETLNRDELEAWKSDASRYLRDANMLTRRFARRVVALADAFEEAHSKLSAYEMVEELVEQNRPVNLEPREVQTRVLRCDHKFVDSSNCSKCGWKP